MAKVTAEVDLCHASAAHKRRAEGHLKGHAMWRPVILRDNLGMRRLSGESEGQALPRRHGERMAGWRRRTGRAPLGSGRIRRSPRRCTWRCCWATGLTATSSRPKLAGWQRAAHVSTAVASADPLHRLCGACAVAITDQQSPMLKPCKPLVRTCHGEGQHPHDLVISRRGRGPSRILLLSSRWRS